jgi:general secretion pathway protein D
MWWPDFGMKSRNAGKFAFCRLRAIVLVGLAACAAPGVDAQTAGEPAASSEIIPGSGQFTGNPRHSRAVATDAKGDITLNFVNADVKDVAKAVLGDYLKLNYEIGASVQGTVTIQTSQPLSREQVIPALDRALRLNNMALVNNDGIYDVVPIAEAQHDTGAIHATGTPAADAMEYGSEAVPLRYVSAAQMQKLLEPLAPAQGIVHVDASRNLLIIEGTADERKTLREDIALFDADWLSGMSFALYTPTYMDAAELARELDQILGSADSPIAGLVKLLPIDRLNAVLAISPQKKYLAKLRFWVDRLDRPGQGTDRRIFVYHVQNGRASDLAATLAKALFGNGGGGEGGATHPTPERVTMPTASTALSGGTLGSGTLGGGSLGGGSLGGGSMPSSSSALPGSTEQFSAYGTLRTAQGTSSVNITADEVNNALVIYATPREYATIEAALHQLDTQPVQVFLEAAIAEVTLNNDMQYGLQYFYQPNSQNQFVLSNGATSAIAAAFPGFSYMFSHGSNIQVVLNALANKTHVEVISAPKVLVLNNQTATLQVGDQVPIETAQAVATIGNNSPIVNSIQYEDTGVILKVTPRVNRGGVVMMDISQEVSGVDATSSAQGIASPTIHQRKIDSSIAIQDGETIALGGLITDSKTLSGSGIPFLQDVPVLGNLFRTTTNNHDRTELIVLITPHVVDNVEKARAITNELRRKLPSLEALLAHDN